MSSSGADLLLSRLDLDMVGCRTVVVLGLRLACWLVDQALGVLRIVPAFCVSEATSWLLWLQGLGYLGGRGQILCSLAVGP